MRTPTGGSVLTPGTDPARRRMAWRAKKLAPASLDPHGRDQANRLGMATPQITEFVRDQTGQLLRTARLLTRSPQDAEDLVQDTLERVNRHWEAVQATASPAAYVRRVMVNALFDSARHAKRHHADTFPALDLERAQAGTDPGESVPDAIALGQALDRLPLRQRSAIVLRYYLQLSTPEIGDAMGIGASTARSLVTRGLSNLRLELADWNQEI